MKKLEWLVIVVLIIVINIAIVYVKSPSSEGAAIAGNTFEYTLPLNRLRTIEGDSLDVRSVPADYLVGVVISPNDCPSCLREIITVNRFYDNYKDSLNVFLLGIFTGGFSDPLYMKKMLNIQFPVVMIENLPANLMHVETPFKFIVDKAESKILYLEKMNITEKDHLRFYKSLEIFAGNY